MLPADERDPDVVDDLVRERDNVDKPLQMALTDANNGGGQSQIRIGRNSKRGWDGMTHTQTAFRVVVERAAQPGRSKEDRILCQCERDAGFGHFDARHRLEKVGEVARRRGLKRMDALDEVERTERGRWGRVEELVGGCALERHAGAEGVIAGWESWISGGRASRRRW